MTGRRDDVVGPDMVGRWSLALVGLDGAEDGVVSIGLESDVFVSIGRNSGVSVVIGRNRGVNEGVAVVAVTFGWLTIV